jgi:hypothetical protein
MNFCTISRYQEKLNVNFNINVKQGHKGSVNTKIKTKLLTKTQNTKFRRYSFISFRD